MIDWNCIVTKTRKSQSENGVACYYNRRKSSFPFSFLSSPEIFRIYNNAIPPSMLAITTVTTPKILTSSGAIFCAPLFDVELEEPDAVSVTVPDPAVAVPVLSVSADPSSCDPSPSNPGPVPAPEVRYFSAALGIAGKESPLISHSVLSVGQVVAAVVEVAPPSPDGLV